ncbi:DUF397 domain-containing protein [Streptomyces orinoci]|uniref:DUF397 domain-containing protein n=1 Tax=Streptomyces orinoci TaxID=67339 RepID=A0ABV3K4N5_STRON|nr:DUF397 domain-containing protein [Streptomyces orinoci]
MPDCQPGLNAAVWRKSSYSNPDGGQCVEVADGIQGQVPVRDSKRPTYTPLTPSIHAWQALVRAIRLGRLEP